MNSLLGHILQGYIILHLPHIGRHVNQICVIPLLINILKGKALRDIIACLQLICSKGQLGAGLISGKNRSSRIIRIALLVDLAAEGLEILEAE